MAQRQRFTNGQIIEAYKSTGSIWRAAKLLGACGQSVWERLLRLNYDMAGHRWTADEVAELALLARHCTLGEIGRRLGRSYASVACKISELGIGIRFGNQVRRKHPRATSLSPDVVRQHVDSLNSWPGSLRQYCIHCGVDIESFVQALQRYEPHFWDTYVRQHSTLATQECPQCGRPFVPMTGKQSTCSRRCTGLLRNDRQYFGGKRPSTIGLADGVCQLCKRQQSTLSSHHVFGKDNDPENDYLIALCRGCHKLVTYLASRPDVATPEFLENLIILCLIRKFGPRHPLGFHVCVDINELTEEDLPTEDVA